MSRRSRRRARALSEQPLAPVAAAASPAAPAALPRGRIPTVGMRELIAAVHRRRDRRRATATELAAALQQLTDAVARHQRRMDEVREAIEAQGGDLSALQHYDTMMARLRAELRAAERSLADAFTSAAHG